MSAPGRGAIVGPARALALVGAAVAAAVVLALACGARQAAAQIPPGCSEICGVSCMKPIAIPDRWDDVTAIPGYDGTGGGKGSPNWRNNGKFDQEAFADLNANGLYDSGEPYTDGNGNGRYDAEAFDPLTTGYVADPTAGNLLSPSGDLGLEITLHPGSGSQAVPGQFQSVDLPPVNRGAPVTGSGPYGENWSNCNPAVVEPADRLQTEPGSLVSPTNQAMRDLVAQDPDAYWDPIRQSVQGSAYAVSPRVIVVALYDPRAPISSGQASTLVVAKVVPVFMEQVTGQATCIARFMRQVTTGATCTGGTAGGFFYACATPADRATWGRVKAAYR